MNVQTNDRTNGGWRKLCRLMTLTHLQPSELVDSLNDFKLNAAVYTTCAVNLCVREKSYGDRVFIEKINLK